MLFFTVVILLFDTLGSERKHHIVKFSLEAKLAAVCESFTFDPDTALHIYIVKVSWGTTALATAEAHASHVVNWIISIRTDPGLARVKVILGLG